MDLKRDREAYVLSEEIKQLTDDKQDNSFFEEYLVSAGRLARTRDFIGKNPEFSTEELPFVYATEDCLKILEDVMNSFLRAPYCSEKFSAVFIDPVVSLYQVDLIVELENMKKITLDYGWKTFYEKLSESVCKIEGDVSRLVAVRASGKNVLFFTNTQTEDFISPCKINFHFLSGKYFVAAGSDANKDRLKTYE